MAYSDDDPRQPIIRPDNPALDPNDPGFDFDRYIQERNAASGNYDPFAPKRPAATDGGPGLGAIGAALANSMRPMPALTAQPTTAPGMMPVGGAGGPVGFDASAPLINRSRGGVSPALGSVLRGGQGNEQTPITQALMAQLLQRRGTPPRIL